MDAHLRINGQAILARRKALGISQTQLAELSGITHSTLRAWEHSTPYTTKADELYRPTLRIAAIARVLGCTPSDIFYPVGPLTLTSYRYLQQIDVMEASHHLPFSNATLTRIELGKRVPTNTEIEAFSQLYNTPRTLIAMAAEETLRQATGFTPLPHTYTTPPTLPDHDIDLFSLLHSLTTIPWRTPVEVDNIHRMLKTPRAHSEALSRGATFATLPTALTYEYAAYLHLPITVFLDKKEAENSVTMLSHAHETLKNNPLLMRQK
ncbi:helix-turn-helix transcriptional regulator [Corynebacterium mastitidis]